MTDLVKRARELAEKGDMTKLIDMTFDQVESFIDAGNHSDQDLLDLWGDAKSLEKKLVEANQGFRIAMTDLENQERHAEQANSWAEKYKDRATAAEAERDAALARVGKLEMALRHIASEHHEGRGFKSHCQTVARRALADDEVKT